MTAQSSPAVALELGWYWVKAGSQKWEVMLFNQHGLFIEAGSQTPWHVEEIDQIGPRIPEPGSAAPRTPAETGEVEVVEIVRRIAEQSDEPFARCEAERALRALAALPPSSGWEAGAEAMRERCAEWHDERADKERDVSRASSRAEEYAAAEIRALPLPPPPSKEGV